MTQGPSLIGCIETSTNDLLYNHEKRKQQKTQKRLATLHAPICVANAGRTLVHNITLSPAASSVSPHWGWKHRLPYAQEGNESWVFHSLQTL